MSAPETPAAPTPPSGKAAPSKEQQQAYWKATIRLTLGLLAIWFAASFGAGILLRDTLDAVSIGGAPLGFWFAQQGAIYVFLVLIVAYCIGMARLAKRYGIRG